MGYGVLGGFGLAFLGFWAGGELGVLFVDGVALFWRHVGSFVRNRSKWWGVAPPYPILTFPGPPKGGTPNGYSERSELGFIHYIYGRG